MLTSKKRMQSFLRQRSSVSYGPSSRRNGVTSDSAAPQAIWDTYCNDLKELSMAKPTDLERMKSLKDVLVKTKISGKRFLIHPQDSTKIKWDFFVGAFIAYSVVVIPYEISFDYLSEETEASIFDIIIDIIFALDMVLNFFTAYLDADGNIVKDRKLIVLNYLKSWFVVDFLSTLPLDVIIKLMLNLDGASGLRSFKLFRSLRIFRLLKLMRLLRLRKLTSVLPPDLINPYVGKLVKTMGVIALLSHLISCLWFLFFSLDPDGSRNWVTYHNLDLTKTSPYLYSLSWVVESMMSVGYGDLYGVTNAERIFSIFVQVIGALSVGFIIANISMLSENLHPQSRELKRKTSEIKQYLSYKNIPKRLRERILFQFEYHWNKRSVFDERRILEAMPRAVQYSILSTERKRLVKLFPLFKKATLDFLLVVIPNLRPIVVAPHQDIVTALTITEDCFFVLQGFVEQLEIVQHTEVISGLYGSGSKLGLDDVINHRPYSATFRSMLLALDLATCLEAFRDCPEASKYVLSATEVLENEVRPAVEASEIVSHPADDKVQMRQLMCWNGRIAKRMENFPRSALLALNSAKHHQPAAPPVAAPGNEEGNEEDKSITAHPPPLPRMRSRCASMLPEALAQMTEEVVDKPVRFIIDHRSKAKMVWDICIGIVIFAGAILIPFRISFHADDVLDFSLYDVATDCLLATDIIVSFRTSFLDENGLTVQDPKKIASRYVRGMFFIDAVSTFPIVKVVEVFVKSDVDGLISLKLIRAIRLVRLLKLLRLLKLKRLVSVIEDDLEINPSTFRLAKLVIPMFLVAHYFGCFWYFVSDDSSNEGDDRWWKEIALDSDTIFSHYVAGVYWAFTTMTTVGYGDILPTNNNEKWYAVVIMMLGATCFAYIVGSVAAVASSTTSTSARIEGCIRRTMEYLTDRKVPQKVRQMCRHHLSQVMLSSSPYDERILLDVLPTAMKHELILFLRQEYIPHIPILRRQPTWFVAFLLQKMTLSCFPHGQKVLLRGDAPSALYFIVSGKLMTVFNDESVFDDSCAQTSTYVRKSNTSSEIGKAGQFIGYRELLEQSRNRASVVAFGHNTEIYTLSKAVIQEFTVQVPYVGAHFRDVLKKAIQRQEQKTSSEFLMTSFAFFNSDSDSDARVVRGMDQVLNWTEGVVKRTTSTVKLEPLKL